MLGESYTISLEANVDNRIVYWSIVGDKLSYLIEEMIIFSDNDFENSSNYTKLEKTQEYEFHEKIKYYNERYVNLLKKHGYIG